MGIVSILLWATLVALIIFLVWKYRKYQTINGEFWSSRKIPTISPPLNFLSNLQERDADLYKQSAGMEIAGFTQFFKPMLYVRDLDMVKNIFVKDFEYFNNRPNFKIDDHMFNDMLVNKENREWKELRSTISPTFTTGKIRNLFPIMHSSSKKLVSFLKNGEEFDFEEVLGRFALDVIISAAAGVESQVFSSENSIVVKMAQKLPLKFSPVFIMKLILNIMFPIVGKLLNFKAINEEGAKFFEKIILQTIKHREETGERRNDFLQLMIDTKNGQMQTEKETEEMDAHEKNAQLTENNEIKTIKITEHSIIANTILFFVAGFDTTQSVLSFAVYALAMNQEVQNTLRRELEDAVENAGGELTYDIVNQNEYLDQFINETQRRYPTFGGHGRIVTKDYTLPNGSILPKGTEVSIPWYQIHHDEKYYPNPTRFDPLRFSKEAKAQRHPYAFMPFGHGPRSCIAKRFALTEMKTVLSELVMKFDFEPCAKTTIPMVFTNTIQLKPKYGMWLKISPRSHS